MESTAADRTCEWSQEIKGQCWGLGPQRPPTSKEECEKACCLEKDCGTWQWRSDKGCFYGQKAKRCEDANAEAMSPWDGGRKFVDVARMIRSGPRMGYLEPRKKAQLDESASGSGGTTRGKRAV